MGFWDNAKLWWRDNTTNDPLIDGKPQQHINELAAELKGMGADDRKDRINHVKAYADYYYHGKERVPAEIARQIQEQEKEAVRLTSVDQAREVLQKYGGPPNRQMIEAALERSAAQRGPSYVAQHSGYAEPLRVARPEPPAQKQAARQEAAQPQRSRTQAAAEGAFVLADATQISGKVKQSTGNGPQPVGQPSDTPVLAHNTDDRHMYHYNPRTEERTPIVSAPLAPIIQPVSKPIGEMSNGELREQMERLEQKITDLAARSKTVPVSELPALREERKSVTAEHQQYDTELANRLSREFRREQHGPEPSVAPNGKVVTPEAYNRELRATPISAWKTGDVVQEADRARAEFSQLASRYQGLPEIPAEVQQRTSQLADYDKRLTEVISNRKEASVSMTEDAPRARMKM